MPFLLILLRSRVFNVSNIDGLAFIYTHYSFSHTKTLVEAAKGTEPRYVGCAIKAVGLGTNIRIQIVSSMRWWTVTKVGDV